MTDPSDAAAAGIPDLQARAGVVSVWLTPEAEGVEPSLSIEVIGGPKPFLRVWLRKPEPTGEWGWVVHESAVCLWQGPEHDPQSGGVVQDVA